MSKPNPDQNKDAVKLAERLLTAFYAIDLQVGHLIEAINTAENFQQNVLYVQRALEYLLLELATLLNATPDEGGSLSILLPKAGKFRVLAQIGIPPGGIPIIELRFSYEPSSIRGIAGIAAATRQVIYIPNIEDSTGPLARYWVRSSRGNSKPTSILCVPFDSRHGDLLAILSISMHNEIESSAIHMLLNPFRAKIELVLLLAQMIEQNSIHNGGPDLGSVELTHLVSTRSTQRETTQPPELMKIASNLVHPSPKVEQREDPVSVLKKKIAKGDFDVFLAHNALDKPTVKTIAELLKQRGIYPWLDTEQIPPGRWFQEVIQQAIPKVKSAAIFIGQNGLGRWEALELRAFISRCVEDGIPVIPVKLPGVESIPRELIFLRELTWVNFTKVDDIEALDLLEWGITNIFPARKTENKTEAP